MLPPIIGVEAWKKENIVFCYAKKTLYLPSTKEFTGDHTRIYSIYRALLHEGFFLLVRLGVNFVPSSIIHVFIPMFFQLLFVMRIQMVYNCR